MKIQLINPPISSFFTRCTRSECFPPLDLLSLAAYIKNKKPECEIEILDGDLRSLEEIKRKLDADIIGISPKVFSYLPSLEIAEAAYRMGTKVIFGGSWSTSIAERIIRNRPYIEAVVKGDGEEALLAVLDNVQNFKIPNLVYREKDRIYSNQNSIIDINKLPFIEFDLLNLKEYSLNYKKQFFEYPFKRPLPIFSQKGCFWYDKSGGCTFCRKQFTHNRRKSPQRFWAEIRYLMSNYGADLIWDVSDTFTEPKEWVKQIVTYKPSDINCKFYFYGRASDINENMVSFLKILDCFELLIGVESGNDILLQKSNKGISKNIIKKAVKLCADNEIQVFPTFLFGLPGENKKSIEETLFFGKELMQFGNIKEISSAILLPLPGSSIFERLCERIGYPSWLVDNDDLDLARIQSLYIELFTETKLEDILIANAKLGSLVKSKNRSSFGIIKY